MSPYIVGEPWVLSNASAAPGQPRIAAEGGSLGQLSAISASADWQAVIRRPTTGAGRGWRPQPAVVALSVPIRSARIHESRPRGTNGRLR